MDGVKGCTRRMRMERIISHEKVSGNFLESGFLCNEGGRNQIEAVHKGCVKDRSEVEEQWSFQGFWK